MCGCAYIKRAQRAARTGNATQVFQYQNEFCSVIGCACSSRGIVVNVCTFGWQKRVHSFASVHVQQRRLPRLGRHVPFNNGDDADQMHLLSQKRRFCCNAIWAITHKTCTDATFCASHTTHCARQRSHGYCVKIDSSSDDYSFYILCFIFIPPPTTLHFDDLLWATAQPCWSHHCSGYLLRAYHVEVLRPKAWQCQK